MYCDCGDIQRKVAQWQWRHYLQWQVLLWLSRHYNDKAYCDYYDIPIQWQVAQCLLDYYNAKFYCDFYDMTTAGCTLIVAILYWQAALRPLRHYNEKVYFFITALQWQSLLRLLQSHNAKSHCDSELSKMASCTVSSCGHVGLACPSCPDNKYYYAHLTEGMCGGAALHRAGRSNALKVGFFSCT